jgi:hypothetical protein
LEAWKQGKYILMIFYYRETEFETETACVHRYIEWQLTVGSSHKENKSMRTSTMFSLCYSTTFKATSHSSAFPSSLHSLTSAFFPLQPKSRNFVYLKESSFPGNSIPTKRQSLCVVSGSKSDDGFHESSFEVRSNLDIFRSMWCNSMIENWKSDIAILWLKIDVNWFNSDFKRHVNLEGTKEKYKDNM